MNLSLQQPPATASTAVRSSVHPYLPSPAFTDPSPPPNPIPIPNTAQESTEAPAAQADNDHLFAPYSWPLHYNSSEILGDMRNQQGSGLAGAWRNVFVPLPGYELEGAEVTQHCNASINDGIASFHLEEERPVVPVPTSIANASSTVAEDSSSCQENVWMSGDSSPAENTAREHRSYGELAPFPLHIDDGREGLPLLPPPSPAPPPTTSSQQSQPSLFRFGQDFSSPPFIVDRNCGRRRLGQRRKSSLPSSNLQLATSPANAGKRPFTGESHISSSSTFISLTRDSFLQKRPTTNDSSPPFAIKFYRDRLSSLSSFEGGSDYSSNPPFTSKNPSSSFNLSPLEPSSQSGSSSSSTSASHDEPHTPPLNFNFNFNHYPSHSETAPTTQHFNLCTTPLIRLVPNVKFFRGRQLGSTNFRSAGTSNADTKLACVLADSLVEFMGQMVKDLDPVQDWNLLNVDVYGREQQGVGSQEQRAVEEARDHLHRVYSEHGPEAYHRLYRCLQLMIFTDVRTIVAGELVRLAKDDGDSLSEEDLWCMPLEMTQRGN
ncbi:hypothetical protein T439DRAFT_332561 [Meredithblackwellia eburnea MCA 4105]